MIDKDLPYPEYTANPAAKYAYIHNDMVCFKESVAIETFGIKQSVLHRAKKTCKDTFNDTDEDDLICMTIHDFLKLPNFRNYVWVG